MDKRILIYNNRTKIAEKIIFLCRQEGIAISVAGDVQQLFSLLEKSEFHLMLVDVEINDKGWDKRIELIADLRGRSRIPLIVVSKQSAETSKIMALEAGADDYVTADCNPLELLARMKSQMRRYTEMTAAHDRACEVCRVGGLALDDRQRMVTVEGRNVRLTPVEYRILRFLAGQKGRVFSPGQIYENVWQMQPVCEDRTIMVHICHIRKKIEDDPRNPKYLKAVWGCGYKVG